MEDISMHKAGIVMGDAVPAIGNFWAEWSGYEVRFPYEDMKEVVLKMSVGIKGKATCLVKVMPNGNINVYH